MQFKVLDARLLYIDRKGDDSGYLPNLVLPIVGWVEDELAGDQLDIVQVV